MNRKKFVYTLAVPPSGNHFYSVNRQGRKFIAPKGRAWQELSALQINGQPRPKEPLAENLRVFLIFEPPDNRIRDIDGPIKHSLDMLTKCRVITDDRFIRYLGVMKLDPKKPGKIVLIVRGSSSMQAPKPTPKNKSIRKKEKKEKLYQKNYGEKANWIRRLKCAGCGTTTYKRAAHHEPPRSRGGKKEDLIPLCERPWGGGCHAERHESKKNFETKYKIDLFQIKKELEEKWKRKQESRLRPQ